MGAYKAIHVLEAARKAFYSANQDENYAKSRANAFVSRCGADINLGPKQLLSHEVVRQVAFSMLDVDTENVFWSSLQ